MTPYQLGEWSVYIVLGLVVVWAATGRWRDYPRPEGRTAEEVAAVARRRSRLFNRSVLTVLALLFLAHIVVIVSY
ncbi:hypothetical protein [Streptomyces sp. HYC2]|uniref:hypothetical protein n=1 Tax=Streptomyces sp. HYC2 TaxID=2955207 RepID=UPI002481844B|nr:hypothetical protein [Streptomyces sp. HYC2]